MPEASSRRRGELAHEVGGEALVARPGPGVWMVKTALARTCARASSSVGPLGHQLARLLHEHERGVALVEVPGRGSDAQLAQGAHAADAEDELLVQAHLAAAHVEDVADGPVALGVLGHVGVEQQQRHAADLHQPDGGVHGRDRAAPR